VIRNTPSMNTHKRQGTTVVELAFVLPVFMLFLWGLIEFGHAYMVINSLNAAAKKAAREGSVDGVSTAVVEQKVRDYLESAIDISSLNVMVKSAGVFDDGGVNPQNIDYANLPPIELAEAEPRQLYIVRVELPYEDVSITPPYWIKGVTLKGQSVMRHE